MSSRYYALEYNPKTKECFVLGSLHASSGSEARIAVNQKYFKYINPGETELHCASESLYHSKYISLVKNTKT